MSKQKNINVGSLRPLVLTMLVGIFGASIVQGAELPTINNNGVIALYASEEVSQMRVRFNYPGISSVVRDSQVSNGFAAPDCLVLTGHFGGHTPKEKVREFVRRIELRDGPGLLFPTSIHGTNVLEPRVIKGTHVFFLKDLSTYVTGLEVRVRDGQTIPRLIQDIFGAEPSNLQLTLSRGCQLMGP